MSSVPSPAVHANMLTRNAASCQSVGCEEPIHGALLIKKQYGVLYSVLLVVVCSITLSLAPVF